LTVPEPTRVLLLGFMASGKTTVGRILADRLGWDHLDFDQEIERLRDTTVAEIFEREGEAAFREMEAAITPRLLARSEAVLTPGGGWITNPRLPAQIPPGTLTVWLKVSPEEAVRRLRGTSVQDRPLLRGPDAESRVAELLRQREPLYAQADITVDTGGREPDEVASELVAIVRSTG
jgi:shikimate kinase